METLTVTLPASGKTIEVQLQRKRMKTCRLKVYPEQKVTLSLPFAVPRAWAESFLLAKGSWIEAKLLAFQSMLGLEASPEIKDGCSVRFLGEDMTLSVTSSKRDHVYLEGKTIHLCSRTPDNPERLSRLLETWQRARLKQLLEERVKEWHPVIESYGIEMPQVAVRKMKTLWGSCHVSRRLVTFNFCLVRADLPCIDYVVVHELIHFIHPNHSKSFYDFLSQCMPDWKERRKLLNRDAARLR